MRVLIAEDDKVFGLDLQDMLEAWGHEVLGPFENVKTCLEAVEHIAIDLALLDVTLKNGESCGPVAAALVARHVPVFLVTGHTRARVESDAQLVGLPTLIKPVSDEMISGILSTAARPSQDRDGMEPVA